MHLLTPAGLNSTSPEPTTEGLWTLIYDSATNSGFRVYHPLAGCYLATTYRQIPHWGGHPASHSVSEQLYLEIEVACSTTPNHDASTFWPVDGFFEPGPTTEASASRGQYHLPRALYDRIIGTVEILRGMYSLHRFRTLYPDLQDFPVAWNVDPKGEFLWRTLLALLVSILGLIGYRHRYASRSAEREKGASRGNGRRLLCVGYLSLRLALGQASRWGVSFALLVGSEMVSEIIFA